MVRGGGAGAEVVDEVDDIMIGGGVVWDGGVYRGGEGRADWVVG
jgi:hypothetical protein